MVVVEGRVGETEVKCRDMGSKGCEVRVTERVIGETVRFRSGMGFAIKTVLPRGWTETHHQTKSISGSVSNNTGRTGGLRSLWVGRQRERERERFIGHRKRDK